jgi:hypothetical protein
MLANASLITAPSRWPKNASAEDIDSAMVPDSIPGPIADFQEKTQKSSH